MDLYSSRRSLSWHEYAAWQEVESAFRTICTANSHGVTRYCVYLPLRKKTPAQTRKADSASAMTRLLSSSPPRDTIHLISTSMAIKNKTPDKILPLPFVITSLKVIFLPAYFRIQRPSRGVKRGEDAVEMLHAECTTEHQV